VSAPRAPVRRPFDLVLFDLDGTLLETAPEIADAVNDALQALDLPAVDEGFVARTIGHGGAALLRRALERPGVGAGAAADPAALTAALSAAFERAAAVRCGTRSRPYPHALELLDALRADGVALALVTNKERRATERLLRAAPPAARSRQRQTTPTNTTSTRDDILVLSA
jgi:phosphoglycolate phosphatase